MNNHPFYKYYDTLFQKKDYSQETDLIFELSNKFGVKNPKKVLEIGCGTGNHTVELLKKDIQLVALDTDKKMLHIAQEKLRSYSNIKLLHTSVEDLTEKEFDLSLAMFNVVTYIQTFPELQSFFESISRSLSPNALFIFDCWNGIAVTKDPPKSKHGQSKYQDFEIDYEVSSKSDFFNQSVNLSYQFKTIKKGTTKIDSFSFLQTLWTPKELQWLLEKSGFEILSCSPLLKPQLKATDRDWKIMFCCRKKRG